MKKLTLPIFFFFLILSLFSSAADWNPTGDISGRGIYKIYNVTNLTVNSKICFQGQGCFNMSNFSSSGGSGASVVTDNLTIKMPGGVITGNYTNGTQGVSVSGNLISIVLSYWNNLFYNKTQSDVTTGLLQTNISNAISSALSDNTTQASQITAINTALANNATRFNADNTTQATQISNEVALQTANNATQASLINAGFTNDSTIFTRESVNNATQASLINGKWNATASNTSRCDATTGKLIQVNITAGGVLVGECGIDQSGSGGSNFTGIINLTQINTTNTPSAGQVLSANGTGDRGTWITPGAGSGTGNTSSVGTAGFIPQFQSGVLLNNSIMQQVGNQVTTLGHFNVTGNEFVNGTLYLTGVRQIVGAPDTTIDMTTQYQTSIGDTIGSKYFTVKANSGVSHVSSWGLAVVSTANSATGTPVAYFGAGPTYVTGGVSGDSVIRQVSNDFYLSNGANPAMKMDANGGFRFYNNLSFDKSVGMGRASNYTDFFYNETANLVTMPNTETGVLWLSVDSGDQTLVDYPITNDTIENTSVSYTMNMDGNKVLTVGAIGNGTSGSVRNLTVTINDTLRVGSIGFIAGSQICTAGNGVCSGGSGFTNGSDITVRQLNVTANITMSKVAIGLNPVYSGGSAVSIGSTPSCTGQDCVAIGNTANAGTGSVAIGHATGGSAQQIAIGDFASATGTNALAIGYVSSATGTRSTSYGMQANAASTDSIAIGYLAKSLHSNSVALGVDSQTTDVNQFMIGNATRYMNVSISSLIGSGNDYVCVDANGRLYRNDIACT